MIYIYYAKLDEIDIKLIRKNSANPEFLLFGCINLEHLFALDHLLLLKISRSSFQLICTCRLPSRHLPAQS